MENDKRNVMDWLNDMAHDDKWPCYYSDSELQLLAKDTLELLKEQEEQIEQLEHDLAVTENNINYYVNGND